MKYAFWFLLMCSLSHGASCPTGQAKDENTLVSIERKWAEAIDHHDAKALDCIVAAEFEGGDLRGELIDRRAAVSRAVSPRVISHNLSDLHAYVYGDFAYTRDVVDAIDLQTRSAVKFRVMNVYVYRDGRWQCIAGQEQLMMWVSE